MIDKIKYGLFLSALIAVIILGLIPGTSIPDIFQFWDKAQHSLAYAGLCVIGCVSFPRHLKWIVSGLVVHGAAIEIMQATLTTSRSGDIFDLMADCVGISVGLICYLIVKRLLGNKFSPE